MESLERLQTTSEEGEALRQAHQRAGNSGEQYLHVVGGGVPRFGELPTPQERDRTETARILEGNHETRAVREHLANMALLSEQTPEAEGRSGLPVSRSAQVDAYREDWAPMVGQQGRLEMRAEEALQANRREYINGSQKLRYAQESGADPAKIAEAQQRVDEILAEGKQLLGEHPDIVGAAVERANSDGFSGRRSKVPVVVMNPEQTAQAVAQQEAAKQ